MSPASQDIGFSMGRNSSHFPGIALESTGTSAFQPIRTLHTDHLSRLTGVAWQIYVHMGSIPPSFHANTKWHFL